jgi:hypothetical protein
MKSPIREQKPIELGSVYIKIIALIKVGVNTLYRFNTYETESE